MDADHVPREGHHRILPPGPPLADDDALRPGRDDGAAMEPERVDHQDDLAITHLQLGQLLEQRSRPDEAKEHLRRAREIWEPLEARGRPTANRQAALERLRR
ncbi:MAG: hypothetical protein H6712_06650 [Myxococcales bacterium]|nr:hypothetical protein [Myxococcales bacterium]MCB9713514.1 hypothetical protein [Myxococcales bacterium]